MKYFGWKNLIYEMLSYLSREWRNVLADYSSCYSSHSLPFGNATSRYFSFSLFSCLKREISLPLKLELWSFPGKIPKHRCFFEKALFLNHSSSLGPSTIFPISGIEPSCSLCGESFNQGNSIREVLVKLRKTGLPATRLKYIVYQEKRFTNYINFENYLFSHACKNFPYTFIPKNFISILNLSRRKFLKLPFFLN